MNPLGPLLLPSTAGPNDLALRCINAIFNCPRDAAAVLFLIEDSTNMDPLWQRLRDSYLPPLLAAVKGGNPSASVEALWMIASDDPSAHRTPQWDNIPAINFSAHGKNTISPVNVARAIEALSGAFGHRSATRHLVIVAALNPSKDVLGPSGTLAWSTAVERLHQEEIQVHLIVPSQTTMDGLTPLYSQLIDKGHAYRSFADDMQFAYYLSDFHGARDKGGGPTVDDRRVPNSGLQSTTNSSSIDKPSLVHELQKINGMEKKRHSRTRRDQPAPNKPGQPYQKRSPNTQTNSSMAQLTSSDPSGHSPPRRKDASHVSRTKGSSSHSNPFPPRNSPDEHRLQCFPSRSSSPSSPYPTAGTSSSSSGSKNLSPLQASLPIPTPAFDHSQHMALTSQSTLYSLSPLSPGYHDFQGYSHGFPEDLRLHRSVSHTIHIDELRFTTTQSCNDIYKRNRPSWNENGRQQGQIKLLAYSRSLASYPPTPNSLALQLAHWPEQATATYSLPPMSHGLGTPAAENPNGGDFYSGYEDRTVGTSLQDIHLLANHPSDGGPSTTTPYYS